MTDKRPPLQYIPSATTNFCLQSNQFDKNTYSRCGYIGNRTQIRCPQVRKKDDLARSGGNCEVHFQLAAGIKRRFELEKKHLENDCPPPVSKKFYRSLHTENAVCDEDPSFATSNTWTSVKNAAQLDDKICRDPFSRGYGGVTTEKELYSIQIEVVEQELKMLQAYQTVNRNNTYRKLSELAQEKSKMQKLTILQTKSYLALKAYTKANQEQQRLHSLTTGPSPGTAKRCIFGMLEDEVVGSVLGGMVDKVSKDIDGPSDNAKETKQVFKCKGSALVEAEFCLGHIRADKKVKLAFSACVKCGEVVLTEGQTLCPSHLHGAEKFKQVSKKPMDIERIIIDEEDVAVARQERELEKRQKEASSKRARRPAPANPGSVSFTSVPPSAASVDPSSNIASHILSLFSSKKDENRSRSYLPTVTSSVDSARCRPFNRDFFGKKYEPSSVGRTTLPYGSAPAIPAPQLTQNRVPSALAGMLPSPSESARVSVPRSNAQPYSTVRSKAAAARVSQQERARNRLQIEEDKKAAASIADDRGELLSPPSSTEPQQFRAIVQSGTPQYRVVQKPPSVVRRPSVTYSRPKLVASSSNLQLDLANLPDDLKNQPLGAVLKTGMNLQSFVVRDSGLATPPGPPPQPVRVTPAVVRAPGPIRRPEGGSILVPGSMRASTVSVGSSQRHQIATVEVPPPRPAMVAPHRAARPMVSIPAAPPPASAPPRHIMPQQPKVIPLERQSGGGGHVPAILGGRRTPIVINKDLVLEKLSPMESSGRPESKTPDSQRPDILRVRKPRETLPLPKIPAGVPRFKTKAPEMSQAPPMAHMIASTSAAPLPKPPAAPAFVSVPSTSSTPVVPPVIVPQAQNAPKKERPTPRQGQRRSSRFDKMDEQMDLLDKDPLSLLADVSMATRQPSGNNSQDEDDYEEEL